MHRVLVVSRNAVGNKNIVEQLHDAPRGANHIMVAGSTPSAATECGLQLLDGGVLRGGCAMHKDVFNRSHESSVRVFEC